MNLDSWLARAKEGPALGCSAFPFEPPGFAMKIPPVAMTGKTYTHKRTHNWRQINAGESRAWKW